MNVAAFGNNIWLLTAGFMLAAAGTPLPALALFALLVEWTDAVHVPLWIGAVVAAAGTIIGHGGTLFIFHVLGRPALEWVGDNWPAARKGIERVHDHVSSVLDHGAWWWLIVLRWASAGYTQVLWILGTLPRLGPGLLLLLAINDFCWALGWTYGLDYLSRLVPVMGKWIDTLVPVLFALYLLLAVGGFITHRHNRG